MRLPFLVVCVFLFSFHVLQASAQQNDFASEPQAQQAAEVVMRDGGDASQKTSTAERRTDLENELQRFDAKTSDHVYFYDERPASELLEDSQLRLVAVTRSSREVFRLGGFETQDRAIEAVPSRSLQEFNRMTSLLQLSVVQEKAVNLAALFLASTDPAAPGEIALDEDAVWFRLAVQDEYLEAYGDVLRALEAYAGWWEDFRSAEPEISPSVTAESNGCYRVILKRLVRSVEKQPEVQNWELEVSRSGEIRVLSMQLIFPLHPSSLFYDFR